MSLLRCYLPLKLPLIALLVGATACGDDGSNNAPDAGPSCADGVKNGDETQRDCGGSCEPCSPGDACIVGDDCTSGVCRSGFCTMPTCNDEVKNGEEIDVDCGGGCKTCSGGQLCNMPSDCTAGVCQNGICADTSCDDKELNVNETDVDCGGTDCDPCDDNARCIEPTDCKSNVCQGGNCLPPTCMDGQVNQDESDQDCGGETCNKCNDGADCIVPADCQSGICDRGACISCVDGNQNGDETARDCGGSCDGCPAGQGCFEDDDCKSNVCVNNTCNSPSCDDKRFNADETDVDCGGPNCDPCANTLMCSVREDCESRVCDSTCQVPTCSDRVLNGLEQDVDCGGTCGKCADFRGCTTNDNCVSGNCAASSTCTVNCTISIGPDDFDYRGCLFKPTTLSCPDISGNGTLANPPHNGSTALIDLGFTFEYYGRSFTQVAIQSNGAITFDAKPLTGSNSDRLRTAAPYDIIAVHWDSLRPKFDDRGDADPDNDLGIMGSNIRYQAMGTMPNRMFVVRWETPRSYGSDKMATFIGVLHEDGTISACYEDSRFEQDCSAFFCYDDADDASIGLYTKDNVFLLSHNAPNAPSGTEVRFTPR